MEKPNMVLRFIILFVVIAIAGTVAYWLTDGDFIWVAASAFVAGAPVFYYGLHKAYWKWRKGE